MTSEADEGAIRSDQLRAGQDIGVTRRWDDLGFGRSNLQSNCCGEFDSLNLEVIRR